MSHWVSTGKTMGWIAGTVLLCAALLLAGCSRTHHTAITPTPTTTKPGARAQAKTAPSADQRAIGKTVATWVTAMIDGNAAQLCSVMGQPATATSPAQPAPSQLCAGAGPQKIVNAWRPSFTPDHMTGQPKVRVSRVPVTGNTASVPARDIHVNGQSLHTLLVSHGLLKNATLDNIHTNKINGSWRVTGFLMP
jgi:ketosteroid isomerase-like protein